VKRYLVIDLRNNKSYWLSEKEIQVIVSFPFWRKYYQIWDPMLLV
jgi:hypothetical protein